MSLDPVDTDIKKGRWYFSIAVGWTGYVLALLIIVGILGTTMYLWVMGMPVPEKLVDWGSVCLGFLAMLISQARDIIRLSETEK